MTSSRRSSSLNWSRPELGEHEDAQDLVLEDHRREEHRFVEVVLGPGDGVGSGVGRGVAEVLGDAVLGDPAGDALAHRDPQLVRRLVDVLADLALHRHRDAGPSPTSR